MHDQPAFASQCVQMRAIKREPAVEIDARSRVFRTTVPQGELARAGQIGSSLRNITNCSTRIAELVRSLPDRKLGTLEQAAIEVVLEETGGNVAATARELGIHRQTLYNKMKAFGIR